MVSSFIKSILIFILVVLGLEYIAYDKPKVYLVAAVLFIVSTLISTSFVKKGRIEHDRFAFAAFSPLFLVSLIVFYIFIPGEILRHSFAVIGGFVNALLIFYIGNVAAKRITLDSKNKYYSLGEISILAYSVLTYCCLFGLFLFLYWPVWLLMVLTLVFSGFMVFFHFSYNKIKLKHNLIIYLIFGLVSCEAAWALSFWPTGLLSRGLVLFIMLYVFMGLIKHYANESLNKKVVREHLALAAVFLALVLGTTKWIF